MNKEEIEMLKNELLNSHWPKCNKIAEELYSIGTEEAKEALIEGLKAKRHHVRTASIVNLSKFNDVSLVDYLQPHLNDPAYETRTEAEKAINHLLGNNN